MKMNNTISRRDTLKKFAVLSTAALMAFCPLLPAAADERKPRILVAFFSRHAEMPEGADAVTHATPAIGNTAVAAKTIAETLRADLYEITSDKKYPVLHRANSQIAEGEKNADTRPKINSPAVDISKYDVIFIGHPIWWYQEPMVIRSFITQHQWNGKRIIPFCTSMAVGIEQARSNIARFAGGARVDEGRRFETGSSGLPAEVRAWLSGLNLK